MSDANRRREGLGRFGVEIGFLDDIGPAAVKFDYPLFDTQIEELELKVAPDDQSSAGFLD